MARPSRKEQLKAERRKQRGGTNAMMGQKLAVAKDKLDPAFEYRWVNDVPGRIESMTSEYEGWEKVQDETIKADEGVGANPNVPVGRTEDGKAMRAYLLRKPKELYEIDQELKAESLDEQMAHIRRGREAQMRPEGQALQGNSYVPAGGVSITEHRSR